MSDDFITIKEATKITDKSDITIRRLIKHLLKQNDPQINQMIRQEKTKGGFIYKIRKDFLLEKLKIDETLKTEPVEIIEPETGIIETIKEVIKTLKNQIEVKDKQIESLSKKIDELIERDRETNIIIKSLQDRVFMLEEGRKPENKAKETQKTSEKEGEKPETIENTNQPENGA